jgi:hypothetical protein
MHYYHITLDLSDSLGRIRTGIAVRAKAYCLFTDLGKHRKIYFIRNGDNWMADFTIHQDRLLPIKIKTHFRRRSWIMYTTLNKGVYPGEPD